MRSTLHFSCRVIEASHLASFKRSFSVQLSRVCGPSGRSVKICVRSTCGRHGRPTEKHRWDCRALGVRLFTRRQGVRRVFSSCAGRNRFRTARRGLFLMPTALVAGASRSLRAVQTKTECYRTRPYSNLAVPLQAIFCSRNICASVFNT